MTESTSKMSFRQEVLVVSMIRTARTVLGWTQQTLAERAGISLVALARLESHASSPRLSTISKLKSALEAAGVLIVEGQPTGGFTLQVTSDALDAAVEHSRRDGGGNAGEKPSD